MLIYRFYKQVGSDILSFFTDFKLKCSCVSNLRGCRSYYGINLI